MKKLPAGLLRVTKGASKKTRWTRVADPGIIARETLEGKGLAGTKWRGYKTVNKAGKESKQKTLQRVVWLGKKTLSPGKVTAHGVSGTKLVRNTKKG